MWFGLIIFKVWLMTIMESIYDKYGNQSFWDHIMDEFYNKNLADPDLQEFFVGKDIQRIKRMNQELLEVALRTSSNHFLVSVKRAHRHMNIFGNHFDKFVSNLNQTLVENHISKPDIEEILTIIDSFRSDLIKD